MRLDEGKIPKNRRGTGEVISSALKLQHEMGLEALCEVLDNILFAMNESTNITIFEANGTIIYANDRFCELSKYTKQELIGKNHRFMSGNLQTIAFFNNIWETILESRIWRGEVQAKAKDGAIFWVSSTIVPFLNEDEAVTHFINFQVDITEKKQIEKQYKTNFIRTFHNLQNGIFRVRKEDDGTLKYTMAEGRLMKLIGASPETIFLKSPKDVFEPHIARVKEKYYLAAFEGKRVQYELEVNGILIYVEIVPIKENGVVREIVGTVHDFSEFRDIQKRLKVNEERYQSLINYSHEYILTLDKDGVILQMNQKTQELFGIQETMYGIINIVEQTEKQKRTDIVASFNKALNGDFQFFEFSVKNNGYHKFLTITLIPLVIDQEVEGVYAIAKDITDEKIVQERNAYLAHHDELTDLPNRRWMEQNIQSSLQLAKDNNYQMAILSLDLDRFKSINDTLGHFVGDELLQQIAIRLRNNEYKEHLHIARMGGDEFMLICPNLPSHEFVKEIAQNILQSLEEPFYIQGFELLITASIGIVFYSSNNDNVTNLMKRVDVALYKAKELGRNMFQIYDRSMNRENYRSFMMERDLRKALLNDEFIMHLQPRVDALTGKTVGAEALVRWNHPEKGLISPGQFIPLAEETGIIIAIGKWIKLKACEQLVKWREAGLPLIPISVNISSNRFLQYDFAEEIRVLLAQFNLAGEWLEIEITENSIMRNEKIVQKTLRDLKEMGVKVFIDDFGTGYSSFNYLKTFEIDGVKIDRSFIHDIANKPENASITSAMIKVAQHLKLEVIAEGVETKEELDYLLGENCHYIQGFYFGKPCAVDDFEKNFLNMKMLSTAK